MIVTLREVTKPHSFFSKGAVKQKGFKHLLDKGPQTIILQWPYRLTNEQTIHKNNFQILNVWQSNVFLIGFLRLVL